MKRNLLTIILSFMSVTMLVAQKKKVNTTKAKNISISKRTKENKTINAIYSGYTGISVTDNYTGKVTNSYLYMMLNRENVIITCIGTSMRDLTNPSNWLNGGTYKIVGDKILVNFTSPKKSNPTYILLDSGDIKISEDITLRFLTSSF